MLFSIILFIVGLILIIKGGDAFVDAASWMARKTGIPELIVGATIVSFATTLPEMLVSFLAIGEDKIDMAIGNVVGSVSVNLGFIMALTLIFAPMVIDRKKYQMTSLLMIGAVFILSVFAFSGYISFIPSILLLGIFFTTMINNVTLAKKEMAFQKQTPTAPSLEETTESKPIINIAKFILGAAAIVVGSRLLVDSASDIAHVLGVPERIIALTIVAIGTSLPELVTTISSIAKKQTSLSIGNIIGANILTLTFILPVSSLISRQPIPVASQFASIDLPFCLFISCLALLPALIKQQFYRLQGILLMVCYLSYMFVNIFFL